MVQKVKKKKQKIIEEHFRVTIFGSARIKKEHPTYKLIYDLAKKIAEEGIDIVTGGGPGLMDAASRGHLAGRKSQKVYFLGLTIQFPAGQKKSYHLDIQKDFAKFSNRLDNFMALSNVVVVAPGGVGTTLEFFYTWQLMQVKHTCDIPIIMIGKQWKELLNWVKKYPLKKELLNKKDLNYIFFVNSLSEAMDLIKKAHEEYLKGNKSVCLNIKRYEI